MSQLSHYAAEILERHNNDLFKQHCRTLMSTNADNSAIASLALAVFGEAPATSSAVDQEGLTGHAYRELKAAGLFDPDSDYDGMLGQAVMELVRVLSAQGHSGTSTFMVLDIFNEVARFNPLTPLTSNEDEWNFIAEDVSGEPGGLWQNKRRSSSFSRDGGKTWYDIEDTSKNNGDVFRRYEDVTLGAIKIGEDRVRVKDDAYEGRFTTHNGKEGLVVGVRNGLITVKYDDDDNDVMGHQHDPKNLERWIEKV